MSLSLKMKALMAAAAFDGFDQDLPVRKMRQWRTETVAFDTGIEQRNQIWTRPLRHWLINWSLLDQAARNQLMEIHDAARGAYDTFLWLDDDEYLASTVAPYRFEDPDGDGIPSFLDADAFDSSVQ